MKGNGQGQAMNSDMDSGRVMEILLGAQRAPGDPDVRLAELLITMDPTDDGSVRRAIAEIIRDVYQD